MREENESIFRRWVEEVWNKGSEKAIEELFNENGVAAYRYFNVVDKPVHGKTRFKDLVRRIREAFDDIRVTIEQITSERNKVVAVCTFAAKRRLVGSNGSLILTPIEVTGLCQMIIENGKIVEVWNNLDVFGASSEQGIGFYS